MLFTTRPQINLFAGWLYVFSGRYRHEVKDDWENLPSWLVATQVVAGVASVLFPMVVMCLLAFVVISRHI